MYDITKSRNTLGDVTADSVTVSNGSASAPSISFGDGDTGFFEAADDVFQVSIAGSTKWEFGATIFGTANDLRCGLVNETASATNPNIVPRQDDSDTGIGSNAANELSLIAGGAEGVRIDTDATAGNTRFMLYDVDNATMERVTVGAADSGGAGFKVLRIPN